MQVEIYAVTVTRRVVEMPEQCPNGHRVNMATNPDADDRRPTVTVLAGETYDVTRSRWTSRPGVLSADVGSREDFYEPMTKPQRDLGYNCGECNAVLVPVDFKTEG
jgi:hypothetical protein